MTKNVGKIDRILRVMLGFFIVWLGLWKLNGLEGNVIGIITSLTSLMPFYMAVTRSCFVFKWFKIHSFSKSECQIRGDPYGKT